MVLEVAFVWSTSFQGSTLAGAGGGSPQDFQFRPTTWERLGPRPPQIFARNVSHRQTLFRRRLRKLNKTDMLPFTLWNERVAVRVQSVSDETVNKQDGSCRLTRKLSVKFNNSYLRKYSSASKTDGIFVFRRPNYIRKSCFGGWNRSWC